MVLRALGVKRDMLKFQGARILPVFRPSTMVIEGEVVNVWDVVFKNHYDPCMSAQSRTAYLNVMTCIWANAEKLIIEIQEDREMTDDEWDAMRTEIHDELDKEIDDAEEPVIRSEIESLDSEEAVDEFIEEHEIEIEFDDEDDLNDKKEALVEKLYGDE